MNASLALLARTFTIGLAVAMPVGAMAILCVERTLERGWRAGAATGAGIATADATYAALSAFGVSAVTGALVSWQMPLRIIGGGALVFLGVKAMLGNKKPRAAATATGRVHPSATYASAAALTLTNPMTIIVFAGIFMGAGLVTAGVREAAVATLGVALGSLSWWMVLVSVIAATRHGLRDEHVVWLSRLSGVALLAFGVYAAGSAFIR